MSDGGGDPACWLGSVCESCGAYVGEDDDHICPVEVDSFVRAIAVPRRLREPRVADALATTPPTMVPTRWGEVAAWRVGSGPSVLLVHGWEDDHSLWSALIDELLARGHAVVAFDLPGHGASGGDQALSFEGCDGIKAVCEALGPVDAVVAHSAGCGVTVGAIIEGWSVARAALIAPPLGQGDRWLRVAERMDVRPEVAVAAKAAYFEVVGPQRAGWNPRAAYPTLGPELDVLVIHSRDDERQDVQNTLDVLGARPGTEIVIVEGLRHRQTARDPGVIATIAAFLERPPTRA